jgi:hypothetical protein
MKQGKTEKAVFAKLSTQKVELGQHDITLSKLEDLKDSLLKEFRKHSDDRDRVFVEVEAAAKKAQSLIKGAKEVESLIERVDKEALSVKKQISDLGVEPPQGLDLVGGRDLIAFSNTIADTYGLMDDFAKMFR